MKTSGFRDTYSPLLNKDVTPEQMATVLACRDEARAEGAMFCEVRYSSYIGPGCAAERGDLVVTVDGKIRWMVRRDGSRY